MAILIGMFLLFSALGVSTNRWYWMKAVVVQHDLTLYRHREAIAISIEPHEEPIKTLHDN